MVDYKKHLDQLVSHSNEKQNSYLSNIFGVSGGAVMYTAWQNIIVGTLELRTLAQALAMLILSLTLIALGYSFLRTSDEPTIN